MTEKEFEQLKAGDKVWIVTDWFNETYGDYQATQLNVIGTESSEFGEDNLVIYAKGRAFRYCDCYLTKSEAWQNEIETMEAIIKAEEKELNEKREKLDRYKSELAKAREEEAVVWVADFLEGKVVRSPKRRWEGSAENYEWSLGSPRYGVFSTRQEAEAELERRKEE